MPDEYNHQMKFKKQSIDSLNFSCFSAPSTVKASVTSDDTPFSMKFVLDDHHGTMVLPVSTHTILSATSGKGDLVSLLFDGEKKLEIIKGDEVVEGEEEYDDDEEDEVSLGSKDTDEEEEPPNPPKRQKTE